MSSAHGEIDRQILDGSRSELASVGAVRAHERVDGSGYPGGFRGEQIALEVRVAAIAGVLDALTDRVYRGAFTLAAALSMLREGRDTRSTPTCSTCSSSRSIRSSQRRANWPTPVT